jgi:hypothetical protein
MERQAARGEIPNLHRIGSDLTLPTNADLIFFSVRPPGEMRRAS